MTKVVAEEMDNGMMHLRVQVIKQPEGGSVDGSANRTFIRGCMLAISGEKDSLLSHGASGETFESVSNPASFP